jgi:hypothetical protein
MELKMNFQGMSQRDQFDLLLSIVRITLGDDEICDFSPQAFRDRMRSKGFPYETTWQICYTVYGKEASEADEPNPVVSSRKAQPWAYRAWKYLINPRARNKYILFRACAK